MSSAYDRPTSGNQPPAPNYVETIIGVAQAAAKPQQHPHPDGLPFMLAPDGFKVHQLPLQDFPPRPKSHVKLRDAASFIAYVNRYKSGDSVIYSTLEPAAFVAVLNDHFPTDAPDPEAGWRDWRATFQIPASREWNLWHQANRKDMSQVGFAEFLEDNLPDIIEPAGNTMLEIALNFEAAKTGSFRGAVRLRDGSSQLQWVDDTQAVGQIKIPDTFKLSIPVFENEAAREVEARLKYRIKDGTLTLRYELIRSHKVLEAAYRETLAKIIEGTGLTPLLGTAE
jgi:uncharacterized protein YfdQ (DUF2303 family)